MFNPVEEIFKAAGTQVPSALFLVVLLVLAGCEQETDAVPETSTDLQYHALDSSGQLLRTSIAFRGVRPSLEEFVQFQNGTLTLESLVDRWLEDSRFGETIRDLHNDALLTRANVLIFNNVGTLAQRGYTLSEVNQSVFEAPLKLIEHVVMNDRPYSEIVTADYTLANQIVADVWGVPYPTENVGWIETAWGDGRPNAGILSDSAIFIRHRSNGQNNHRARAAVIANALLCFDFLSRDIQIDGSVDLSDEDAVANAVVDTPACASCHQTLDPLASFLSGHSRNLVAQLAQSYPLQGYDSAGEKEWIRTTKRAPAYFGESGGNLADLGIYIAADPRFAQCAARRFYSYFHQVPMADVPFSAIVELQESLVSQNYSAKALAKAVVLREDFKRSHADTDEGAATLIGYKKARPEQLARMVEDLTGFRWRTELPVNFQNGTLGPIDLMTTDLLGFRTLAGGHDSFYVTQAARNMNVTSMLTLQNLAQLAAAHVVTQDFSGSGQKRLLSLVDNLTTDEAEIKLQLQQLHLRILGEKLATTDPMLQETWELFSAAYALNNQVERAWMLTIAAMLQDMKVAYY